MTQKGRKTTATALQVATFTQKWFPLLETLEKEIESHKTLSDDSHLAQADAVAKTQNTLLSFDAEAKAQSISKANYTLAYNPFVLADGLRAFCFAFCDEWQKLKNEQWGGMPKHSVWFRELKGKINPILARNRDMNPERVKEQRGPRKGSNEKKGKGKGKKKSGESDEDSDGDFEI